MVVVGSRLTRRRRTELMIDRCILRSCGGKRQDTSSQFEPKTQPAEIRFVAALDLPLCSSFLPIVWRRQGRQGARGGTTRTHSRVSRGVSRGQTPHFPLPASTMTGRRRPRRGQNGSNERLFWSLAVIIAVLVVSYWYDGGDDDATKQNRGEYEPVLPRTIGANRKVGRGSGKF